MAIPSYIYVPVEYETFKSLQELLAENGEYKNVFEAIDDAIDMYFGAVMADPGVLDARIISHGYRWKTLTLPSGSRIRMKYKGEYHYAEVVDDEFQWNGKPSSPSQFAGGVTGTARNAWRDLEIRFPGSSSWTVAEELRRQSQ